MRPATRCARTVYFAINSDGDTGIADVNYADSKGNQSTYISIAWIYI